MIESAFKTACILHNMLRRWDSPSDKNVDWDSIDPDVVIDVDEEVEVNNEEEEAAGHEEVVFGDEEELAENFHMDIFSLSAAVGDPIVITTHEQLTELLVDNFYHNYCLGLVQWPHESTVSLRHLHRSSFKRVRYNRKSQEQKEALYKRPSKLVCNNNAIIGDGLFSCMAYKENDFIAEFKGIIQNHDEFLADVQNGKSGYHVLLRGRATGDPNAQFLQCYDNRFNGVCYASLSNSPKIVHI